MMGWVQVGVLILVGFGLLLGAGRLVQAPDQAELRSFQARMLRVVGVMLIVVTGVYLLVRGAPGAQVEVGLFIAVAAGGLLIMGTGTALLRRSMRREDPVLGALRFVPSAPPFWVAEAVPFAPTESTIEVTFDAAWDESFAPQQRFLAELERRYVDLRSAAAQLIQADGACGNLPTATLILSDVDIPARGDASAEWSMTWTAEGETKSIGITMNGWHAAGVASK